ncbi:hypothetical protein CGRA01v4_11563 [Colletotrichum graminicola]|nr:hypothetical protein CGRA01v4_11563 [Colletotrichum graminicola]
MSFSNSSGGTLTVPSPTHVHHADVLASSVRSLRRSLSRSPSKFSLARTSSPSSESSHSGSHTPVQQQSPCRRYTPTPTPPSSSHDNTTAFGESFQSHTPAGLPHSMTSTTPFSSPPSLATPFRPNVRLSLRSAKTSKATGSPSRPATRLRTSPKSPLKRALSATTESGVNSTPSSSSSSEASGQENNQSSAQQSPHSRSSAQKSRHSLHLDVSGHAQQTNIFKHLESNGDSQGAPGSGALKRSDAIMNLDQASLGSPVAKRRSLHGISNFGQNTTDFNIFDNTSSTTSKTNFDIHDEANREREYELFGSSPAAREPFSSPTPPPQIPRRTGSLRRSTLQQRQHDRSSWGRKSGANHLAQMAGEFSSPNLKNRPRLSMDQFLPPQLPRDSPFTSNGSLPNPSAHPIDRPFHQPHPLSKTLVTSTSGNNLEEQNNSMPPPYVFEKPRAPLSFAKSMPYGSSRPSFMQEEGENVTPFKAAKPWAGAFMSTGLVSKVNRNPEEDNKLTMPDTPCKKPTNGFATFPPPPGSAIKKSNRYSFGGMPSTPFNAPGAPSRSTFGNPGKGLGIFQRLGSRHARRGSVLSLDDDKKFSLDTNFNVGPGAETDAPPTPTKQGLTPSLSNLSERSIESPSAKRSLPPPMSAVRPMISRESTGKCASQERSGNEDDSDSPSPRFGPAISPTSRLSSSQHFYLPSFCRSRTARGQLDPAACAYQMNLLAKNTTQNTASPVEQRSPRTPSTHVILPDASCLSISNPAESQSTTTPVTPSGRDSFQSTTTQLMTPVNAGRGNADVDDSLYSRFDKVEMVGKGEFSSVYRVVKAGYSRASFLSVFSGTPTKNPRESPEPDRIYAVKKARRQFTGPKDRLSKLREVQALQALTHADHVVHYVDSWEYNQYLYIQTEYCDEGTLDKFLSNVGRKGRLDDFRIWKVIHDIGLSGLRLTKRQGLQSIHEAGFIHLDLKPANILITFEGILKIGDFGLATEWPAAKGVDAEGDREYIGPEILRGDFNKPADIFSLGLITIEMAANVVLPDNGPTWVALRSGDLSEVPSLTFSATTTINAHRDAAGVPTVQSLDDPLLGQTSAPDISLHSGAAPTRVSVIMDDESPFITRKRTELRSPPDFMSDPFHPSSLDQIVRWMISPEPSERPTIQQLLSTPSMVWVAQRRRSAATVFEGVWGPSESTALPTLVDEDIEMMDV